MFWRPLTRGGREYWWDAMMRSGCDAGGSAAAIVVKHFGTIFTRQHDYANDRDHIRW